MIAPYNSEIFCLKISHLAPQNRPMTTLLEAQAKLAEYKAAETRILEAQEVRIGSGGTDRVDRQTDLAEVRKGIVEWQRIVDRLSAVASGKPTFGGLTYTSARFN